MKKKNRGIGGVEKVGEGVVEERGGSRVRVMGTGRGGEGIRKMIKNPGSAGYAGLV